MSYINPNVKVYRKFKFLPSELITDIIKNENKTTELMACIDSDQVGLNDDGMAEHLLQGHEKW